MDAESELVQSSPDRVVLGDRVFLISVVVFFFYKQQVASKYPIIFAKSPVFW